MPDDVTNELRYFEKRAEQMLVHEHLREHGVGNITPLREQGIEGLLAPGDHRGRPASLS